MQAASSDAPSLDGVVASGQDAVEPSRSNPPEHQFDAGEVGLSPGGLIRAHGAYSGASACSCACKYARYQDSSPCTMLAGVSRVVSTVCKSVLWWLNGPNSLRFVHPPHAFPRRGALGCSRQGEGCTIELDSSSLAPGVGPPHPVTTPAGREEQGTSLYSSYTDPPHAPWPGQCQEATSGVSCRPESPGPGNSGPASLTPSPPGLALAAGAIAGAVGARGI